MRLVDADKLKEVFERNSGANLEKAILEIIDSQTTAYDIGKCMDRVKEYLHDIYCIEDDERILQIIKDGG